MRASTRWARAFSPSVVSKIYPFSTLTQGSCRRFALTASRARVSSFSLVRRSSRAASHSGLDTILGFLMLFSITAILLRDSKYEWCFDATLRAYVLTQRD